MLVLQVTLAADGQAHLLHRWEQHWDLLVARALNPHGPNPLKFELFVFDALPMVERWPAVEV